MLAEAWNPLEEGGYTGTGIAPSLIQAKKVQIISSPGGYTRSALSPGLNACVE